MECIEWKPTKPEHFRLFINGVDCGEWHVSQMRHFIQVTDNTIENYLP